MSDDPREANTEGGVFPAIFGTVLMVFMMTIIVTPLGIIAAIYLREYASQGVITQTVRIAVNNLAGVPSIVYGVFGLGFFVYFLGGNIDKLFYPESAPAPVFGTPAVPSTLIGLYHMNIGGRLVHKYLPKDETQSISKNSFIGQTVTITTGHAQLGQPAEAKFQDQFGQMHYVMVEPDEADYSFNEGSTALIIRQDGEIYRVVPNIDYLLAKTRSQQ